MAAYVFRRLLLIIPTLLGIMFLNFAIIQFIPGGPVEQMLANLENLGDGFDLLGGAAGDAG
ncbi:MAG: microcin ABC transporter permease, partial [Rhodobacteraceae bacterium]|nr:microcin ABC transporter permease [Paracoccaceae bacterium]